MSLKRLLLAAVALLALSWSSVHAGVWVRGGYRGLGVGSGSMPKLLEAIREPLRNEGVGKLVVRYPRLGSSLGEDRKSTRLNSSH